MKKTIRLSEKSRELLNKIKSENMLATQDAAILFMAKEIEELKKYSIRP